MSKKTLILSAAIAVVVTVPAVAWAVAGPFGADPQPPTTTSDAAPDAPYGWMGQMHDYMWGNGELPEDLPADAADWMGQIGLTPDQLSVVFERFYRADHTGPGGSGIGLTIAQAITRRHGGDITATSPGPGKGSTFTLTLPLP